MNVFDLFGSFGSRDPRKMPGSLFRGAVRLDYATAVRADTAAQQFTVCPRHWYVDAAFHCAWCGQTFVFSAAEQRFWYEQLKFYVGSRVKHCKACRHDLRELKALRQAYDRDVVAALRKTASVEQKIQVVAAIDALNEGGVELPEKVRQNRRVLGRQIERVRRPGVA